MTTDTAALVRQLRDAANALVDRNFTFFSGQMLGASRKITRDEVMAARTAIAAADQWLAQPPTNQCGETCERAALCATCARGLEQSRVPLTNEWLLDAAGETLYLHHRNEVDSLVRACAEAWGYKLAGEDKPC